MFLIMALMSRYMIPSDKLIDYYEEWLLRKKNSFQPLERLIKTTLVNFKIVGTQTLPEKGLFICWPPSACEI